MNGVDKYVTESMLTTKEEDIVLEKPIAEARPRQEPAITLTSVSIPVLERKWIEIETQRLHNHKCQKQSPDCYDMIKSVYQKIDKQPGYIDIIEECRKRKFDDASQRILDDCISTLAKGGGAEKRFQHCVNPNSSNQFLYLRCNSKTFRRQCC